VVEIFWIFPAWQNQTFCFRVTRFRPTFRMLR
jgi:hypothetical protein